jgi:hypothetical protein
VSGRRELGDDSVVCFNRREPLAAPRLLRPGAPTLSLALDFRRQPCPVQPVFLSAARNCARRLRLDAGAKPCHHETVRG